MKWQQSRAAEVQYARDLRKLAREIGRIINQYTIKTLHDFAPLKIALEKYESILTPWAKTRAHMMVSQVEKNDRRIWAANTREMSAAIRTELTRAPIGHRMREIMEGQVSLIRSLPREAAERVHKLVIENAENQNRASEIAKEIRRSGEVTESRATLIARTEVSRTASVLTQARAEYIGSEGYIWRTVHDADVRPSHRKMDGKFVAYDKPPTLDGLTGHAGALPNCRCYQEPVIPKELL